MSSDHQTVKASSGSPEPKDKEYEGSLNTEGNKMVMQDREAKIAQLRKKFVGISATAVIIYGSKPDKACSYEDFGSRIGRFHESKSRNVSPG